MADGNISLGGRGGTININESQANDSSQINTTQNLRRKVDITWKHCYQITTNDGKSGLKCMHCGHVSKGGGINRMKQHLAGITGNIASCPKVSADVHFQINGLIKEHDASKKDRARSKARIDDLEYENIDDFIQEKGDGSVSKKKRKSDNIESYMKGNAGIDKSQPSIQSAMLSKKRIHETDMAIALWIYDACIPINAVNSPLYEAAMSRVAKMGHGYTPPNYHNLRVNLLREAKKQVELTIDDIRNKWIETGCTIMGDGWTDQRGRQLINFLVYCPHGISFIKSVDASDYVTNAVKLCDLFSEIVEMVGVKNVVHIVTDNASNYKAAGKLLTHKYPTLFWSPCSAHCINLIMKDIVELDNVKELVVRASRITVFVYNHKWPRSFLKQREGWTEILRPGATQFGTTFIALKSLCHLEAMVLNAEFKKFVKTANGKEVKEIIIDGTFWKKCENIVKVMAPIMIMLRMCDSDEKPSLGYVYEGMIRIINGIKQAFKNKEEQYEPYITIIEKRWDKMLRKRLHAAAFWLNPIFQYDSSSPTQGPEAMRGLLEVLQKLAPDDDLLNEISMFKERKKTFGMPMALKGVKNCRPDQWWMIFGGDAPKLQKIAFKILSQTSSSGAERNWSVFERIHTKRRNRLEHQRLNDLSLFTITCDYVDGGKLESYDPMDYESIDKVESWVIDEDLSEELDIDELEDAFAKASKGIQDDVNETINLENVDGDGTSSSRGDGLPINMDSDEDY